jgi:hypothetical protein
MPDCALLIAVVSSGCRDSMRSVVPAFSTFCRPSRMPSAMVGVRTHCLGSIPAIQAHW